MSAWNGRGRPPGVSPGWPTLKPQSMSEVSVTIRCPDCGDLHSYGAHQLRPTPIYPGDWRLVHCIDRAQRSAAGYLPNFILFDHERLDTP